MDGAHVYSLYSQLSNSVGLSVMLAMHLNDSEYTIMAARVFTSNLYSE